MLRLRLKIFLPLLLSGLVVLHLSGCATTGEPQTVPACDCPQEPEPAGE